MSTTFSPPPWEVSGQSEAARYIRVTDSNGRTVARIPWSSDADGEAGTANDNDNAVLIAQAPAMFYELHKTHMELMDEIKGMHGYSRAGEARIAEIGKLLNKARPLII